MSEYIAKYDKLPQENKLLFAVDLVKEKLTEAYQAEIEPVMSNIISGIMGFYKAICNK